MKYDIKNTLEVIDLGMAIGKGVDSALDDGKIDMGDIGHLMSIVPRIKPAIDDIAMIPKELGDLDEGEQKEIIAYVAELAGKEQAWDIAIASLKTGLSIVHLISVIRNGDAS